MRQRLPDSAHDTPPLSVFNQFVADCPVIDDAAGDPCMSSPCSTCPYRRTQSSWLNSWRFLVNVFRLRERRVQNCHSSPSLKCAGAVIAIAGGSADVCSADEFEAVDPCPDSEVSRRYQAAQSR